MGSSLDARTWIAGLFVVVALAGCLGTSGGGTDAVPTADGDPARTVPALPDFDFSDEIEDAHAHEVPEIHTTNYNLETVDFDPATDGIEPTGQFSGFSEVDVHEDLVAVGSVEGQRGVTILRWTDDGLETLSHVYSGSENWDPRFSDDGRWLFLGCQGGGRFGAYTSGNAPQTGTEYHAAPGGCRSDAVPQPPGHPDYEGSGIMAIDVSDPTTPTVEAFTPSAKIHNLYTATIDGSVIVVDQAGEVFEFDPEAKTFTQLTRIGETTHDIAIQAHPVTGDWLLYTGSGGGGLRIYDFEDPSDPTVLSTLDEYLGVPVVGWHEQTPAPGLIDGRHLTFAAGEQFQGLPGPVSVVDTTDPEDPKLLGQWRIPGSYTPQQSYKFSNHNIDVNADGRVAIGMYHAGVWVFDVSTEERMRFPVTVAYHQPHEINPRAGQQPSPYGSFTGSPYVWGAMWADDDRLVIPDMNSGVYLLEPTWNTTMVS